MSGFISFVVVLAVFSATLRLIVVTLDNASGTIAAAIRGDARAAVTVLRIQPRATRQIVVIRPAFALLRAVA